MKRLSIQMAFSFYDSVYHKCRFLIWYTMCVKITRLNLVIFCPTRPQILPKNTKTAAEYEPVMNALIFSWKFRTRVL